MARFGFVGASYQSESPNVDAESTLNWYPETVESGQGTTPVAMYPTPGIKPFSQVSGAAVRGLYEFNGRTFAVGTNFAEILSDGSAVGYGFLPSDNNPVSMAANNANQLIICTGGQLWLFPLTPGAIIYTNVPDTITTIQIVDNGNPSVKDYYFTCSTVPPWTVGTTLAIAGVTTLPFLNGVSGTIQSIAGNIVHMQLPRSLTLGFSETITNLVIAANAPVSVGPMYASLGLDVGGPNAWANPQYIGALIQSTVFTSSAHGSLFTNQVEGYTFGFAVPSGASIQGIQISVTGSVDNAAALTADTIAVQMYKAGIAVGLTTGGGGTYGNSPTTKTFGNSTDLWGTTWTAADINDPRFGVGIECHANNTSGVSHFLSLNQLNVTVWYTTFNGTFTLSQAAAFTQTGQPISFGGLTNNTGLNGQTYPQVSASGSTLVVSGVPGPAYSGAETGTATGEIVNYGPTSDTGTVSGTVISYITNPVEVAIGQGPFSTVDFVDGYFLALQSDSQLFQISDLEDGTTWNPINKFQVEEYADNIISMIVDHREIWFFGPKRTLVYYDSGDPLVPFQPIPGAFIEQGIAAEWSVCRLDNSIFWLGADERGNGVAWRANGYTPVRVSNHGVENLWRQYPTITDVIAWTYVENGHTFWLLWFPSGNATWVYDAATGQWHQRTWFSNGSANAHLGRVHSFSFGQHLVGDRLSGTIYSMSINNLTDTVSGISGVIQRIRRAPHISNEQEWMFHQQLQVYIEPGLSSATTAIASQPSIILRDTSGQAWAMTVTSLGQIQLTTSSGVDQIVVMQDQVNTLNYYTLQANTSGQLVIQPCVPTPQTMLAVALVAPNAQVWTLTIANGMIISNQQGSFGLVQTQTAQQAVYMQDPSGAIWAMGVTKNGFLTTTSPAAGYIQTLFLQDQAVPTNAYLLQVDVSGFLILQPVTNPYASPYVALQDSNNGVWQVGVSNGMLTTTSAVPGFLPPQISLRWSNDGAHTWSNYYPVSAGSLGEFTTRCMWRRLGRARDRVYEITCTDPIPWRIVDAYLQAVPGFTPTPRLVDTLKKGA